MISLMLASWDFAVCCKNTSWIDDRESIIRLEMHLFLKTEVDGVADI